ncbi:MAG: RAMP superfamily CRISPR-associated protein [Anaerolineae bacterium]
MLLRGKLLAEAPIYRGNARKTLFTRDGDGTQRLVSLAGEIAGTAQSLMDAFIGQSSNGKNIGLLDQLWRRLYDTSLPHNLITHVECRLQPESYPQDNFFDLRMGVKLDEDRWAVESNANYKMETIFRHSVFELNISVDDATLKKGDNQARLYYLLQELREGRFWFGAGKSKGLGRCLLNIDLPFAAPATAPQLHPDVNHLKIDLTFNALNPVLVGWNWGRVESGDAPAFAAIEGRLLVAAMHNLPDAIRQRLEMGLGGPILNPEDWKKKLADYLPRVIAIWLRERSSGQTEIWLLPAAAVAKLSKGKFALSNKVLDQLKPLVDQSYPGREAATAALKAALGEKSNMLKRVLEVFETKREANQEFNRAAWLEVADTLELEANLADTLATQINDEAALAATLKAACQPILRRLNQQVDQQVNLLQSDVWLDAEIANREAHLRIKNMLLRGKITERDWGNRHQAPEGVGLAAWREFLDSHNRVRFQHLLNARNLQKSITNDQNFITFLKAYRDRTRQELAQPHHIDFREGGRANREISRKYGKPYDRVFMRMLSWTPSAQEQGQWEIFIPGSTIKGAFKKRAAQLLKTLWGETERTTELLDLLFGRQGQRGLIFFSDAHLVDPYQPEERWCTMDGVRMDPKTGQPIEGAKHDYLFAYGDKLSFKFQLDWQDLVPSDVPAFNLLTHLLQDFERGDIPLGGEKTSGFGWVEGKVSGLSWLTAAAEGVNQKLFGSATLTPHGPWQTLELGGLAAAAILQVGAALTSEATKVAKTPPKAGAGFTSHRAFGGYSGLLTLEGEILTPTHVRESGEPSHQAHLADGPINGWDFFAMAPAEAALRESSKTYALPSKSIRGMLRHIYAIASNSRQPSQDLSRLNPEDSLFGWVGRGQNQSIMGRLVFNFGFFEQPQLAWFKTPYPYGGWRYQNGQWQNVSRGGGAPQLVIANQWRLFPHVPPAPIVKQLADFQPDSAQASYFRAILPGSRCRFTIRFWNLDQTELQRLLWCIAPGPGYAHKIGKHRHLGLGSLRLQLLPESYLIDWAKRYAGSTEAEWQTPLPAEQWLNPQVIEHYNELSQALDAHGL